MKRCFRVLGLISFPFLLARADAQQSACSYSFGLVSKTDIDLKGNDVYVDSFDSTDPTKSTDGQYDPAKRQPNGNVTAGRSLTNSVLDSGKANICGIVFVGPSNMTSALFRATAVLVRGHLV